MPASLFDTRYHAVALETKGAVLVTADVAIPPVHQRDKDSAVNEHRGAHGARIDEPSSLQVSEFSALGQFTT